MPSVRCPVCLITYEVAPEESGGKIQCRVCGQKMRVAAPPAGENKTVLVRWEEPEDEPAPRRTAEPTRRGVEEPPPVRAARPAREERDADDEGEEPPRRAKSRPRVDDDDEERPRRRSHRKADTRYCRHCDRHVRPDYAMRMAQPAAIICLVVGVVLVFLLVGVALIVLGILMKQRVETCPDCGDELHVGDITFGG